MTLAAPFGISRGMTLSQVLALGGDPLANQPFRYKVPSVPKPHPAFESYIVDVAESGAAGVTGIGRDITTSVYGEAIRSTFEELASSVGRKYGPGELLDYLKAGSIWHEPNEWTMALLKNERTLACCWGEEGGGDLGSGLHAITLMAQMTDNATGYLTLSYEFDNHQEYVEAVKALHDDAL